MYGEWPVSLPYYHGVQAMVILKTDDDPAKCRKMTGMADPEEDAKI